MSDLTGQKFALVAIALCLGCAPLPAPVIEPAACTYDRCALWRSGETVYRGAGGDAVGRLRGLGLTRLEPFLAGNDSALRLAREHRSLHTQAMLLRLVGVPVVAVAPIVVLVGAGGGSPPAGVTAGLAAGAAALIFSFVRDEEASWRIGRAIFLYNRDLPRSARPDSAQPSGRPVRSR